MVFNNVKTIDYDFYNIMNHLKYGPILLSSGSTDLDEGITWVCDGYAHIAGEMEYIVMTYNGNYMDATPLMCFTEVFRTYTSTVGYHTLHMNWGLDPKLNGSYSDNSWVINYGDRLLNYNKNRKATVGFN